MYTPWLKTVVSLAPQPQLNKRVLFTLRHQRQAGLYLSDFHWGGGSEFRLAMTDRATIVGMEVAKLVL